MSQMLELSLEDSRRHLIEPPIVDQLYYEPAREAYIVTFVPSEYCSRAATELVAVTNTEALRPDFDRIAARLDQLAARLTEGRPIARLVHAGGGDFTLHDDRGRAFHLSDPTFDSLTTFDACHAIQDIGQAAETAFRLHALTSSA
jgi:hypothetical protein